MKFRKTFMLSALGMGVLSLSALAVAEAANARFLYTVHNNQVVRGFAINATSGALSTVPGDPQIVDEFPLDLAGTPDGKYIYSLNPSTEDIAGFTVNAAKGSLTKIAGSPFLIPAERSGVRMIIHPNGKFAYLSARAYEIWPFTVKPSGQLLAVGNAATGGVNSTLTIDPSGKFLYAANAGISFIPDPAKTNNISAFTINATTGALTEISGSPFKSGTDPQRLSVDPTGKFLLVSSTVSKDVRSYSINGTTGALTQLQVVGTGGGNYDVRFGASGKFAYVTIPDTKRIQVYSLAANGKLTLASTFMTGSALPNLIGVDPAGKFLFVSQFGNNSIQVVSYKTDATTGALSVSSGPFTVDPESPIEGMVISALAP